MRSFSFLRVADFGDTEGKVAHVGAQKNACRHGTEERSPCCGGPAAGEELCCLVAPSAAVTLHSRPASRPLPPSAASAAPGFPRPSLPNLRRKQQCRYGGARRCWAEFLENQSQFAFLRVIIILIIIHQNDLHHIFLLPSLFFFFSFY